MNCGNCEVTGSNPVEVLNFFFSSFCDDHFFIFISFPQFLYDLFHILIRRTNKIGQSVLNLKLRVSYI